LTFTTTNLTPRIGTEVRTDLDTLLSGRHAHDLRALLEQRGVLLFRNITINDDQQLAFGQTLGRTREEFGIKVTPITIDRETSPRFAEYARGTEHWHIDGTYTELPPLASILRPLVLSPWGGETEFANTYAAYEDLSDEEKLLFDTLEVVHIQEAMMRAVYPDPTEEQLAVWGEGAVPPKTHPMVWHHRSGRKSLLLAITAVRVAGMAPAESDALLARLRTWSEKPDYVYRHHWRMGDMLIWDNTGTMHRVLPYDYDSGRMLRRVTLIGEESVTATVKPSPAFAGEEGPA
jgi:alpha-ketoglutarate-dependent taurine dioxygenase